MQIRLFDVENFEYRWRKTVKFDDGFNQILRFIKSFPDSKIKYDDIRSEIIIYAEKWTYGVKCTRNQFKQIKEAINDYYNKK